MKNKILLSIFLGSLLFSCSDDIFTENYADAGLIIVDDKAIKTSDDLDRAIKGLYSNLSNTSGFGGDHFTYQELTADIGFVALSNAGYFLGTNGGTHIQVDGGASGGLWVSFYNSIANANFVLGYRGKIVEGENDGHKAEEYFTHAKIIKAYNYLALLSYFSPNYGEGDQTLGVPYPESFDINARLPRESVSKTVSNVIADLESSLAYFENNFIEGGLYENNRSFSPVAVKLLLARVNLYKKDYAKAIKYSQDVLDDPSSLLLKRGDVSMYFSNVVEGERNQETIFQLEFNDLSPQGLTDYWGSISRYKQNFMARSFYEKFVSPTTIPSAQRDIRTTTWYTTNNTVNGMTDNPKPIDVRKYNTGARDLVQLRKTEAIFIKAESQFHSDPALASKTLTDWIKEYRFPAYTPPVTSGAGVLDEILNQKGFEFFLEGLRFSDLKRNNRSIVKYQTNVTGQPLTTIPAGDKRFIWPIPLNEMQNNPNIKQAPGY